MIGLTGEGLHIDAEIALGSARLALPVVAADRQGVTAVSEQSHQALARVRLARSWADRFMSAAPAVVTLGQAAMEDPRQCGSTMPMTCANRRSAVK